MAYFKIDDLELDNIVTTCKESFEVTDSDSSGRTKDWVMHRDVVGTFYNFNIGISSIFDIDLYNKVYKLISSPQASHTITCPYNGDLITFEGYITKGSREIDCIRNGVVVYKEITFNCIAIEPQRRT